MEKFVHLHLHTDYSLLDGAIKINEVAKKARAFGMDAVAITDHGNMFGAIEFYKTMKKYDLKPIIGIEMYMSDKSIAVQDKKEKLFHLTLLAETNEGYSNLMKLTSLSYLEGFYRKPRIDRETLARYNKGIIALSGCKSGEINRLLLNDRYEEALDAVDFYVSVFGRENFFLELQDTGQEWSKKLIKELMSLSRETSVPVVATNDCHYLTREDAKAHEVLLAIQTKRKLSDGNRLRFETEENYFKSPNEMVELFKEIPEAISNTIKIAEMTNVSLKLHEGANIPHFTIPEPYKDSSEYLKYLAYEGLARIGKTNEIKYRERLEYELDVAQKLGFSGYFLIAYDIVKFAKDNGIAVGPGRGSAASSLVLYTLSITDIDPLKYNLIFERFLNPARVSLPDVDIDFAEDRRDEVIEYLIDKYGNNNVARIVTFGKMKARAVLKDVARVMDFSFQESNRIAKLIPMNFTLSQAISEVKELKELIEKNEKFSELIEIALRLEGLARHSSVHAAGIVITPGELTDYVPLYKTKDGEVLTQYEMHSIEALRLIKMDILGLRTLSEIDYIVKRVKEKNPDFREEGIDYSDKKTFNILKKGDTTGIFQLESSGMRDILRGIAPERIEDIIAVISLFRPGPLANINLKELFDIRRGKKKPTYIYPPLEKILNETFGLILYQEQVMQIARDIAGFTMSEADNLRKAMGKKNPELMEKMRKEFTQRAEAQGLSKAKAEEIFSYMAPFAGYGFNKSHATGYAYLSYLTAYLKANFPQEFYTGLLTYEAGKNKDVKVYKIIKDARSHGIDILPPSINKSQITFTMEGKNIRFGLSAIKNVGKQAALDIIKERGKGEFKSFLNFVIRLSKYNHLNRKAAEYLVKAGAFDEIDKDRNELLSTFDSVWKNKGKKAGGIQKTFFKMEEEVEKLHILKKEISEYEKECFGFYLTRHPLEPLLPIIRIFSVTDIEDLSKTLEKTKVRFAGVITSIERKRDKKNRIYVQVTVSDVTGEAKLLVFSDRYNKYYTYLEEGRIIIVEGEYDPVDEGGNIPTVIVNKIVPKEKFTKGIKGIKLNIELDRLELKELEQLRDLMLMYKGGKIVEVNTILEGKRIKRYISGLNIDVTPEVIEKLSKKPFIRNVVPIF